MVLYPLHGILFKIEPNVANFNSSSISVIREGSAGIEKVSKNKPENRFFEIFSNPFESNIKIRYSVDKPSNVTFKI